LVIGGGVVAFLAVIYVALVFTPLGPLLPIENPELEHRYSQELLSLNQRLTKMMEELVEMREYNVRLRKALGENVALTDSGVAVIERRRERDSEPGERQRERVLWSPTQIEDRSPLARAQFLPIARDEAQQIVFPVILPVEGYITRGFDAAQRHYGIDIAGRTGSLINAAADGHVVFSGWTSDDGNKVILSHRGGFLTVYKHNQSLLTSPNAFVRRGEPIALLGNTGRTSSAPHLHFEIWKDGVPVDPAAYILNFDF
jgi:murein DD-endopeptidase MepM/ murein hydrolase activator NlpD